MAQNEQLEKKNQQLEDLNREKDGLMRIVAHDLKAPLKRIKGIMEIMRMSGDMNPAQTEYFQMINNVIDGGDHLIRDLLDIHALEYQKGSPVHLETLLLGSLLEEVVLSYTRQLNEKNIFLQKDIPENLEIETDKRQFERIIDNLFSNAVKFTPQNRTVGISAVEDSEKREMIIHIKDEGPGFTEEDQQHLFKMFKKLSARPTGGETSNGLGLSIVKSLVDRLGATIRLANTSHKGSTFSITFPLQYREGSLNSK